MKPTRTHWSESTFVVTHQGIGPLGINIPGSRHGYCSVCKADMAQYKDTKVIHYASHKRAKALGLWGKSR